ncbi:basic proline-rich protein-like [Argiope bruennichi]|uniref:basic proline-rich protein-like n=1 Tax=Argiope bruennichi TaxID=94029 RepID=UPI002494B573|nr:basic proline-rich protein-like [Argiope bruennichi]
MPKLPSIPGMPGMPPNTRVVVPWDKLPKQPGIPPGPRRQPPPAPPPISPDQPPAPPPGPPVQPPPKPDKPNGRRWFPPRGGKGRPGHGYGPGIGIGPNATIGQIPPGRKGAGGGVPDIDIVGFLQDTSIPERDGPSRQYMFGWPSRPVIPPGHVAVPPEALLMPKLPSIPGMPGMPPNTRVVVPWDKLPKQPGIPPGPRRQPPPAPPPISPDQPPAPPPGPPVQPPPKPDKPNGRRWFPPRGGKGRPGHGYGPGIGIGPNATIGQIPPGRKGAGGGVPDIDIVGFLQDTSIPERDGPSRQYMFGRPSRPVIPPGHVAVPPEALLMPKLPSIPGMPGMPPNTRVVVPWDKLPKQPGIPPGPRRQPPPAPPPISPDQPPAPPPGPPVQPAPKPDKPNGRRWFPPRGGKGRPGHGYGPGIGSGPNATIGQIPPGRKGGGGGLPDIEIGGFLRDTSEAGRDGTPGVSIGSRRKVRQYTWKPSGSSISRGSNNYLSGKKSRKPLDFRRDGRYKQKRKRKLRKPLDGRRGGRYKQKRKRKLRKPLDGRRDGRYRQKLKRKLRKPLDGRRDGRYRQKLKRKLESVGRKVVQMENKSAKEEQHNNISNRKKYAPTWDRDPPRVNIRRNASPLKKLQKRNKP